MKESHKGLYGELSTGISAGRLKEITIEIIGRYKKKDYRYLAGLAEKIGVSSAESDMSSLFSRIVQLYHPDKLNKITGDIEEFYNTGNTDALVKMKNIYLVDIKKVPLANDYSFEEENEFFYDDATPGYYEEEDEYDFVNDEEPAAFDDEDELNDDEMYGFIEAVNDLYLGNLEYELSVTDLQNLEGELDLSGFDIDDLTGAEYCINITTLNLSGNRLYKINQLSSLDKLESLYLSENSIEDISCLSSLTHLRELDVSFNAIEDISVLLHMPALKYVNLIGNPVKGNSVIRSLSSGGVIVIY